MKSREDNFYLLEILVNENKSLVLVDDKWVLKSRGYYIFDYEEDKKVGVVKGSFEWIIEIIKIVYYLWV